MLREIEDRTVCYIDLMGFSAAVSARSKEPNGLSEITALLRKAEALVKGYSDADLRFQSLSDSIFISTVNRSPDNVLSLLTCAQDLFIFFLTEGFLARGGIASGPCVFTESIVLGEPVVRAVKLESQIAEYPRIVLSKGTMDTLSSHPSQSYIKKHIERSEDGPYWVNPFSLLFELLIDADSHWKEEAVKGESGGERYNSRGELIKKVNLISEFISTNLYSLQEDRKSYSYHFWISKQYRRKLCEAALVVGTELKNPQFSA